MQGDDGRQGRGQDGQEHPHQDHHDQYLMDDGCMSVTTNTEAGL